MAIIEGDSINFKEHGETLLYHLHQLWTYNMFLDACLVCNDTEIYAHKSVLAAASPILRERLNEFGDCHHVRIEIEQQIDNLYVIGEDIKLLVEFIYRGQVCIPQQRLNLFLELGNQFQIQGLYKPNMGYPFLSQPLPNYNLPNEDPMNYEEVRESYNDFPFNDFAHIPNPEKYTDNSILPDRSLNNATVNLEENFQLFPERTIEPNSESNPKYLCDFQNWLCSEILPSSSSYQQYDTTDSFLNIQSEHGKHIPEVQGTDDDQGKNFLDDQFSQLSSSSEADDSEVLFDDLSGQPNSLFASNYLESGNSCIQNVRLDPCKIQDPNSIPERQVRLKVKDSIGGVSLQDTSQSDLASILEIQVDSSCSNQSVSTCDKVQIGNISSEVEEIPNEQNETIEHMCSQCSDKFATLDECTLHLWEKHKIGKHHQCLLCSFSTIIERKLFEHGKTHINSSERQCSICGKKFKTRATLRNHLLCHASDKWFKCNKCSAHYSQRNSLLRHMASEHRLDADGNSLKESLSCPDCSFNTWAPHNFTEHRSRCHTQDKPYKCSDCSYSSTEKTSLSKHIRTHTHERPFICDSCSLSFATVSTLKRHSRSHTKEKPYKCAECGQQYADKKRLHDHQLRHKNIKPFKCDFCNYHCRRKDNLQSHMKRTHTNKKDCTELLHNTTARENIKMDKTELTLRSMDKMTL